MNLEWNVFRYDFNGKEIIDYNVFNHYGFAQDIKELLSKKLTKEQFSEEAKHDAMYHFWSRCEYETVITSWPPYITSEEKERIIADTSPYPNVCPAVGEKIDVYRQLEMNWDRFVDYVWRSK